MSVVELTASEIEQVSGGLDLSGVGFSENVTRQYWTKEGNLYVLYNTSGQCIAAQFNSPY
jgi:hypothetical protein